MTPVLRSLAEGRRSGEARPVYHDVAREDESRWRGEGDGGEVERRGDRRRVAKSVQVHGLSIGGERQGEIKPQPASRGHALFSRI